MGDRHRESCRAAPCGPILAFVILCGIDFSHESTEAARAALAFARVLSEPVTLVHVAGAGDAPGPAERESATRLEELAATLDAGGVELRVKTTGGSPSTALVKEATAEGGATLLVLGARGGSGGAWLVGSVAERTALASPRPTLLVRSAEAFEVWASGGRPLRVAFAAEVSPSAVNAVPLAGRLAAARPCEISVLHSAWPPDVHERLAFEGQMPLDRLRPDVAAALEQELRAALDGPAGWDASKVRYLVEANFGRCADHLVQMAERERADLLLTGMHQRSTLGRLWHGSVSWGVMQVAPMSVLAVPFTAS